MSRRTRILLGALTAIVPFLPLYVARTMVRAQVIGHAGDRITYGWRRVSLPEYLDVLAFMRPEQAPHAVLALDLALALLYAGCSLRSWPGSSRVSPAASRDHSVSPRGPAARHEPRGRSELLS